jgi:uncharacterized HAD superfamily protein
MPKDKPVIAVDIDDVLAASATGFIDWTNKKFGTHLTIEDYDEHWATVWKVERAEADRLSDEYHGSGYANDFAIFGEAKEVLEELKQRFTLILVTSRKRVLQKLTEEWINKHFPNIFRDCVFCGFYDVPEVYGIHLTKTDFLKNIQADYFIDDQLKHVESAAEAGIPALLFGDYLWNRKDNLHKNIVRVKNWREVFEYFKSV